MKKKHRAKSLDREESVEEDVSFAKLKKENSSLKTHISFLKKEIKKLKSEIRTLNSAWEKTEVFLKDVTNGRSLESVIKNVAVDGKLEIFDEKKCRKCQKNNVTIIKLSRQTILACQSCGHKETNNDKKN